MFLGGRHTSCLARGRSKARAKRTAEVRRILEAPGLGNGGDGLLRFRRVAQIVPAAVQPRTPDQIVNGLVRIADSAMQTPFGGIEVTGNAVNGQVRVVQVLRYIVA